ncbi:MAG: hypothetical protein KAI47_25425, partial [Deltaproteobacteria bacterium]|nr:hypothetical protein [Deltaproteobacteria bacterium]
VRSGYSKNEMCALRDFVSHDYYLLMEQMEQVRISDDVAPPTREEFRKICDEKKTQEAILDTLGSLKP